VVLRVTPHIIEENHREMVKLAIQIEDGGVEGRTSIILFPHKI
jgi:hypothetical protein